MNSSENRATRFPVAALFLLITAIFHPIFSYWIRLSMITLNPFPFGDFSLIQRLLQDRAYYSTLAPQLIYGLVLIVLCILLFMRKRNGVLTAFVLLVALWNIVSPMRSLLLLIMYGQSNPITLISLLFVTIAHILLVPLAFFPVLKKESGFARVFRYLWFLPGVCDLLSNLITLLPALRSMAGQVYVLQFAFSLPYMIGLFLLGWWLVHLDGQKQLTDSVPTQPEYAAPTPDQSQPSFTAASSTVQKTFCPGCGQELGPNDLFCANCGCKRPDSVSQTGSSSAGQAGHDADAPSGGMTALGFFFPVVGLILYLIWKDQTPLKAKSAGKGALIGVIVWTVLSVLITILSAVIPLLMLRSSYY